MNFLSTIVVINMFGLSVATESTSVVNIDTGPVQGQILTTFTSVKYAVFKGIPYGKPPIGDLRFKPPVPADPWTEILNATAEGSPCVQYNHFVGRILGSEACLFINVYTPVVDVPKRPKKLKAVVYWVYGGAFLHGPPTLEFKIQPDTFITEDVIYVTANYRAGLFGFLALNHTNATGNAGLKDVVLALKWIQRNIEQFGGDPSKVTLGGGSSGGAIVQYLMFSAGAAGLYRGIISMSGTPLSTWAFHTPAAALTQAQKLAEIMGMNATDSESLFDAFFIADPVEVVNATSILANTFGPFRPTIEDPSIATDILLDLCTIDKYRSGDFIKVPVILGYADQETVTSVNGFDKISDLFDIVVESAETLNVALPPSIDEFMNSLNSSENFYDTVNYTDLEIFVNDTTDFLYIAPIDLSRKLIAANNDGVPVYYYHLSYNAPGPHTIDPNNTLPGAGHGDDLPFVFYMQDQNFADNPTASLLRQRMSTMFSNFVKYGDPTPSWKDDNVLNITWPETGSSGLILNFGPELIIEQDPMRQNAKSFERIIEPSFREANGCE